MADTGEKTLPKKGYPRDKKPDISVLAAGRYGTPEMEKIFGPNQTFDLSLRAQGQAALTLSRMYPNLIPAEIAREISEKASIKSVNPDRIRQIEAETDHDVIAINTALSEVLSEKAKPYINRFKTSADTTQPTKAIQIKQAMEVIIDTVENLRDILIEKSLEWIDCPHMDQTHRYDALPTVAGRPFAHYAEMLQSCLNVMRFFYYNSIKGKWADATGNHHSAHEFGVNGILLQEEYCKDLKISFMDAPAQIPGLEFEADIIYSLARLGMTMNNISRYIAEGRGDNVDIFRYNNPNKKVKGSGGMPHKDAKLGNPIAEEQIVSVANKMVGALVTALMNCDMPYARTLFASANSRIDMEDCFKFFDHAARRLSGIVFYLELKNDRSVDRVLRSYGVVTSPLVLTNLTSHPTNPMAWRDAHDLIGKLASDAWNNKKMFYDVLSENGEITKRIDKNKLKEITDPLRYIGQSKEIINTVARKCHHNKTLE